MTETQLRLDRREAILDVAAAVFLEDGYAAASMSCIAARLGGSKGTLYNYFNSKEELFRAHVRRHCAWRQETMFALLSEESDLRVMLRQFGRRFLDVVLADLSLENFRLIAAEAQRAPEIGHEFHEAGPMTAARKLSTLLQSAASHGRVSLKDPLAAAHLFIALCQNRLWKARICAVSAKPADAEIDAEVELAVEVFMAAVTKGVL